MTGYCKKCGEQVCEQSIYLVNAEHQLFEANAIIRQQELMIVQLEQLIESMGQTNKAILKRIAG